MRLLIMFGKRITTKVALGNLPRSLNSESDVQWCPQCGRDGRATAERYEAIDHLVDARQVVVLRAEEHEQDLDRRRLAHQPEAAQRTKRVCEFRSGIEDRLSNQVIIPIQVEQDVELVSRTAGLNLDATFILDEVISDRAIRQEPSILRLPPPKRLPSLEAKFDAEFFRATLIPKVGHVSSTIVPF